MTVPDNQLATGQVILNTGDGKGKTTAAMGLVLRLAGHGRKVLVLQFAKAASPSGERDALAALNDLVTVKAFGRGWLDLDADPPRDEDVTQLAADWTEALSLIRDGNYDAVVLDEIAFVTGRGFLPAAEVVAFLDEKPPGMTVVMTGRGAPAELIERADVVTEMRMIKHSFDRGREAQPGIEY